LEETLSSVICLICVVHMVAVPPSAGIDATRTLRPFFAVCIVIIISASLLIVSVEDAMLLIALVLREPRVIRARGIERFFVLRGNKQYPFNPQMR